MKLLIHSLALALPRVARHPNRRPFRGVLTLVDSPSDRPPAGARGHRVVLTRAAAERAIPSLLGMGLDFTAAFDGHDVRRKVGIITSAEIASSQSKLESGNSKLVVTGFLFARDFPEVVREIQLGAHSLGMSYEVAAARVRDPSARVWMLDEVTFTGAAVLRRDKAAYQNTSIELITDHQEKLMTPELTQQFVDSTARLAAATESLEHTVARFDSDRDALSQKVERIIAAVEDPSGNAGKIAQLENRIAELERANSELKANTNVTRSASSASARKTLPPLVTALLAKHGLEGEQHLDLATLDKTLAPLSVEQRMAVKAQMARAGIID